MQITEKQIKRITKAVMSIENDVLIDDDVSGGYLPEPFKTSIGEIYTIIDECERGLYNDNTHE